MTTDTSLLRAYVTEGSETAFAELVKRYLPLVYSAAMRRLDGDTHSAGDVSQLVFISMARRSRSLLRHTSLAAWLFTATRNAVISFQRSEYRRQSRENSASTLVEQERQPDWERLRRLLDKAMDRLNEKERELILLHFFQGQRYLEISEAHGLSQDAVRKRVDRALVKLRDILKSAGMASTTSTLGALLSTNGVLAAPYALTGNIIASATTANAGLAAGILTSTGITTMGLMKIVTGVAVIALVLIIGGTVIIKGHRANPIATEVVTSERETPTSQMGNDTRLADRSTLAAMSGFIQLAQERMSNKLTIHEAQVLDQLYKDLVREREKVEFALARSDRVNDDSVLITIPEYFSAGVELYQTFVDRVIAELGRSRGKEIIRTLDPSIRADNFSFGVAEQNILVEDRGETFYILHGSGGLMQVNDQMVPSENMYISNVSKTNLLGYDFLKSLFPKD